MTRLVAGNLFRHPLRTLLTVAALGIAIFLLCFLQTIVTSLEAGVESASSRRLWVQSAVSLFIDLPVSYENKIAALPEVTNTCKWQWFGGYFQDRSNFFAQFSCDPVKLREMWPELELVDGSWEDFARTRTGAVVGYRLAEQFGWKVGDAVPLISPLFPNATGTAWDFTICGIYRPGSATIDPTTFFFQWDYFTENVREATGEDPGVGVIVIETGPGADAPEVMRAVDDLFENGPQRVQTTTEAEFQRQFVTMIGNLPRFLGFIGGGVFLAILLGCINTMLMAAREQVHDVGILKSLGFSDGAMFRYLFAQSFTLSLLGGALGIAVALATAPGIAAGLGSFLPGFRIRTGTLVTAALITAAVAVFAGIVPALQARRLQAVEALRMEE